MSVSISMPNEMLVAGQIRAKQDNRTFSSYLQMLVAKDIRNSDTVKEAEDAD